MNTSMQIVYAVAKSLFTFINSTRRWECLNEVNIKKEDYRKSVPHMLSSRDDSCQTLRKSWEEIHNTLTYIQSDVSEKAVTRCEGQC